MIAPRYANALRAHQHGVGLVETMVGILIGLVVVLVVYNILAVAEGYRRTTIGSSDAQVTGLLSQFVAGRDAGNGGAGITVSASDLQNCILDELGNDVGLEAQVKVIDLSAALRPIPVLIRNNGGAWSDVPGFGPVSTADDPTKSDWFISMHGAAAHVMWPVDLALDFAHTFPFPQGVLGAPIVVQSPNGFTVPPPSAATPYWAVLMSNETSGANVGKCKVIKIAAASAPDAFGTVTLTQDPSAASTLGYTGNGPARLLNLGPDGLATRVIYDVDNIAPSNNAVLRTTNLLTTNAPPVANPIAQNIVLMKVQYGLDTVTLGTGLPDGIVNCWTPAIDNSPCAYGGNNNFSEAAVRKLTLDQLNRIFAIRIAVVVRSDEPDLKVLTDPTNPELIAEAAGVLAATRPPVVLFNCSLNTNAGCPGRVVLPMGGTLPKGKPTCAPAVICDYWRYRVYETIVPIRNTIFAATLPP
jgi:Type IV Pilus-assembly protein W